MRESKKSQLINKLVGLSYHLDSISTRSSERFWVIDNEWLFTYSTYADEYQQYVCLDLLKNKTGVISRQLIISREFDKAKCEFKFRVVGIMYRYGREVHKLDLDDLYLVTPEQLEYVIDDVMTSTYVSALYDGVIASDLQKVKGRFYHE